MNPRYPPEVLSTDSNYKGLSYGDLVAIRANWLFSESPDYQYQSDILHLHGNMHYSSGQAAQADDFYDRRGDLEERITPDTAIFVPVMTATYVIGDKYEGLTLEDEVHSEGPQEWISFLAAACGQQFSRRRNQTNGNLS